MGKIKIILEKTGTGYSAYAPEENGIYTAGEDIFKIREYIKEVVALQAEYIAEQGNSQEAERLKTSEIVFYLDVKQFFEYYSMLNKTAFAKYIGMNESHLRKISSGLMALSDTKAQQIQNGLHKLATEFRSVHFA